MDFRKLFPNGNGVTTIEKDLAVIFNNYDEINGKRERNGLGKAIVVSQINYWNEINERDGNNYMDGYYWTYNSYQGWAEHDFPFWSADTVKRIFLSLEAIGVIVSANYNKMKIDKTKWYRLDESRLAEIIEITQRGEKDKKQNTPSIGAKCPDHSATMHNDKCKIHRAIPETNNIDYNTEINTDIKRKTEEEKEIKKKKPYIVLPDIPDAKPCEKNMDRDSKLFDMYANIRIKAMNVFKYDIESAKVITKVLEYVCRTYETETKYKHGIICGEGNIEKSIQFVIDNAKQLTAVIEQYQVFVNTHKSDYLHCQFTDFVNEFTERTA